MELKDLVGTHMLSGIKRGKGFYGHTWCGEKEEVQFVAFRCANDAEMCEVCWERYRNGGRT